MNVYIVGFIIFAGILAAGIFLGFIGGAPKNFKSDLTSLHTQSAQIKKKQKQSIEETELKRRQMMEDLRQKIRDGQHNNF